MLDEENGRFCANNKFIHLTEMETQILAFLIENKNKRVSSRAIARVVYGMTPYTISLRTSLYKRIGEIRDKLQKYVEIDCKRDKGYLVKYVGEK